MDGGGRVVGPLGAGFSGEAAARTSSGQRWGALQRPRRRSGLLLSTLGFRRRSSIAVPIESRVPRFLGTALVFAFFGAIASYGVVTNGQWDAFKAQHGEPRDRIARAMGFGLDKVTISGIARMSEADVLRIAGIDARSSLPFLSAASVRDRLAADPFVKTVEVRKLYPNDLTITLVERTPYALWQMDGELYVIAADGTAIDRMRDAGLAGLPLVVGEGANLKAPAYVALLDAAGPLRSQIRAGMLVSGRRWTIKMETGLDVRLPEENAPAAVARLVRLQRSGGLLDKDVLAIDLRMPDRVVIRLTEEAASARQDSMKKKLQRGAKGIDT